MLHLSGVWVELLGWAAVLAGLAVLAGVIVLIDRRRPSPQREEVAATLDPEREWELVIHSASAGLARGADLAVLQADAAMKIEAAEHAYRRLVADCAKLCLTCAVPASEPPPQPVSELKEIPSEPEKVAEQPPLAA
jgi:hypothetical protein